MRSKPSVVLVDSPYTGNAISDLLVAGYEKFLAPVLGYTNPDKVLAATAVEVATSRDGDGNVISASNPVDLLGHSRGTIVERNALNLIAEQNASLPPEQQFNGNNLTVEAKGPAVSEQALNAAYNQIATKEKPVKYASFPNDPISTFVGSSPNGNGWTSIKEIVRVVTASNSAHSCYGTGAPGCTQVEVPYSYGDMDPKTLQALRQTEVDKLLQSGKLYVPSSVFQVVDPLAQMRDQAQQDWRQQLQNNLVVPSIILVPTFLTPVSNDPRVQQLLRLQQQLQQPASSVTAP